MAASGQSAPDGRWDFALGMLMVLLAAFALLDSVKISSGLWHAAGLGARTSFALAVIPVVAGLLVVYFGGSWRRYGWAVWALGAALVLAGLASNASVYRGNAARIGLVSAAVLFGGGMGMILLALRKAA